jgi:hypothetical protein
VNKKQEINANENVRIKINVDKSATIKNIKVLKVIFY